MTLKLRQNSETGRMKSEKTEEKNIRLFLCRRMGDNLRQVSNSASTTCGTQTATIHNRIMFCRAASENGGNKCCHKNFSDSRTAMLDL